MKPIITFSDFQKLELVAGTICEAERITDSDKLVTLQVNLGGEKRQLIAGIGKKYEPEKLIGLQIIVLANLEPKKMMGFESQGMLLAADVNGEPVLTTMVEKVPDGSTIR